MKRIVLLSLLAAFAAFGETQTRVTSAVVFKNGLAFVTREGTLAYSAGRASLSPIPDALLGTLWIAADGRTIDEVRASKDALISSRGAATIDDLLEANVGKQATIRVGDREYTGTLLKSPATSTATGLVFIEAGGKIQAFERANVHSISFVDAPVTELPARKPALTISSRGADGAARTMFSYLRSNLSWIPEYTITLADGGHARVAMQAMLINDGEELRDARVQFAVGFPSFEFSRLQSPMTAQHTLEEFLARLANDQQRDANPAPLSVNVMTQQATYPVDAGLDASGIANRFSCETAEDLFFYETPRVTLGAGERASYPILSQSVPFRHVYVWEVPADPDPRTNYGANYTPRPADQVWHSIVLTNEGPTPWTTGPALVLSNGKPLAQNTMGYTSVGARGNVKLTVATDVGVERDEAEVERKANDLVRFGNRYDAVIVEGTLKAHNFKRQPITLNIVKSIEGTALSRNPEGKVTRRALHVQAVNPTERMEWDVPLAAGEEKVVKYRYKVWVRE